MERLGLGHVDRFDYRYPYRPELGYLFPQRRLLGEHRHEAHREVPCCLAHHVLRVVHRVVHYLVFLDLFAELFERFPLVLVLLRVARHVVDAPADHALVPVAARLDDVGCAFALYRRW